MAEIKPMALIESMKKKVCEHSDVYFRTNKKTGKVYTGKLCYPSTKEPSAAQTAAKARFAKVSAAVLAIGGLVLLFCGVYIAPQGEIHESLLVGFGEVVSFPFWAFAAHRLVK